MNLTPLVPLVKRLTELIPLERPLIFFDTETTGPEKTEDRIVEIGFILARPEESEPKEWQSYVNPGIPIPPEATYGNPEKGYSGHGITDAKVQGCKICGLGSGDTDAHAMLGDNPHTFERWPSFAELAPSLLRHFRAGTDYGGFNIKTFDLPLMQAEFERSGVRWFYADARLVDGYRIWQLGEPRSLSDAVREFLGEGHEGAHRALDDVRASLRVVVAQLERFATLPRDLGRLHELCWPTDPNAVDPDGKIIWRNDLLGWAAVMNFGKNWKGKRLDLMSRRDLEWIVSPACAGANPTVKFICAEAIEGRFPIRETA